MDEKTKYSTCYARRSLGVVIALLPFIVVTLSLLSPWHSPLKSIAVGLGVVAVIITTLNLWITLILPSIQRKKNRKNESNHSSSTFPVLGTVFALGACLVGFGHTTPSILALVTLLFDFGGLPWFIVFTWKDPSLWDSPLNDGSIQSR